MTTYSKKKLPDKPIDLSKARGKLAGKVWRLEHLALNVQLSRNIIRFLAFFVFLPVVYKYFTAGVLDMDHLLKVALFGMGFAVLGHYFLRFPVVAMSSAFLLFLALCLSYWIPEGWKGTGVGLISPFRPLALHVAFLIQLLTGIYTFWRGEKMYREIVEAMETEGVSMDENSTEGVH